MLTKGEEIRNYMRLFQTPEGKTVNHIRVSTLSRYYHCAIQAYFTACGIESPPPKEATHRINVGTEIHEAITKARKPSQWETEFYEKLKPYIEEISKQGIELSRKWDDTLIENDDAGWIGGHPDEIKVNEDHTITLIEYKTKKSPYVDYYALSPAEFQIKIYSWILEPICSLLGYRITRAQIVFLDQKEQPIGIKDVFLNYENIEREIRMVLEEFKKNPKDMVPPAMWKCRVCPSVYKERCPFQ